MNTSELIQQLQKITIENQCFVKELLQKSEQELNYRKQENSWSILECIEHLNLYGDFYLPEIKLALQKTSKPTKSTFKSGILGGYFVRFIQPKAKKNKIKTASVMNPIGRKLNKSCLERFVEQQAQLLDFLQQAYNVDLIKTKTKISISRFIKLRLGDTLQFVVFHNQRHICQVKEIVVLF